MDKACGLHMVDDYAADDSDPDAASAVRWL